MIELVVGEVVWGAALLGVAGSFFYLGWALHRDRYVMRLPRRPRRRR